MLHDAETIARMTADCRNIDTDGEKWWAQLWCNAIGEHVTGYGNTIWQAVQAAHDEKSARTPTR